MRLTAGLVLLVVGLCLGCANNRQESDVRSKIQSSLPIGTSKADVIRYLDENGFYYIDDPKKLPSSPNQHDGEWLPASLESRGILGRSYIVVDFYFDKTSHALIDYSIHSFNPDWKWP
jgi:hypothetical protein